MAEILGKRTPSTPGLDPKRTGRLVVGVVALALSIGYLFQSLSMPQGTLDSPGPGMFPVGVGVAAILISLVVIAEGLAGVGTRGSLELPVGFERRQVLIFMGTLVGFILILPLAGQYLAASIYVMATLKFLGRLSWIRSIIFGVLIGAGVSLLFSEVLEIPLPAGLL
jgi:putative tricarboxylic transport membrane protein